MSSTNVNQHVNVPSKLETSLQAALTGVQTVLTALPAGTKLTVAKVAYDAPGLVTQLQSFLTPLTDARQAKLVAAQKMQTANTARPLGKQFLKAFKATLAGFYGASATDLTQFGFTPAKARTPLTSAQQVVKTAKLRATRTARGTMGKAQKASIKGSVPAAVTVSTGGQATIASPAPTPSPAPVAK